MWAGLVASYTLPETIALIPECSKVDCFSSTSKMYIQLVGNHHPHTTLHESKPKFVIVRASIGFSYYLRSDIGLKVHANLYRCKNLNYLRLKRLKSNSKQMKGLKKTG